MKGKKNRRTHVPNENGPKTDDCVPKCTFEVNTYLSEPGALGTRANGIMLRCPSCCVNDFVMLSSGWAALPFESPNSRSLGRAVRRRILVDLVEPPKSLWSIEMQFIVNKKQSQQNKIWTKVKLRLSSHSLETRPPHTNCSVFRFFDSHAPKIVDG